MPVHGEQIGWPQATTLPTYTVWRDGVVYYAMNNTTGAIDFQGADPAVVVQACLTAGGAGTVVGMREAVYVALTGVAATANNQGVYGMGDGTYWDATALLTGTHGFTISGFTGCTLRNFAVETDAGGTLVNHCVFIEDGADDFHLIDLTIVDSDSDGIHVEGTTIDTGYITRCHIQGADGDGILVDMDAANFMYRLHVEDNDIVGCGGRGIAFDVSGGNRYCQIINNIVYNCGGIGIELNDGDFSTVRGNTCIGNGGNGIRLDDCAQALVIGNISQGNTGYGIILIASDYCTVVGNTCQGNTNDGIILGSANNYCTVTGNTCLENEGNGIGVSSADECTVVGNTCSLNVEHGIGIDFADNNVVSGNSCIGNDSGNTGAFDGISLFGSNNNLIMGNQCQLNDRWGIMIDSDSDYNKISNNYTNGNTAGSIRVNNANCDGNEIVFNTVEEGAPGDIGTLTRASGNFDPSANAYIAPIGAAPF